ncbi:MAG: universal stress protein [Dactylosporangium sp.]|nr:universal stress protein [Dactylosporangium sp.]
MLARCWSRWAWARLAVQLAATLHATVHAVAVHREASPSVTLPAVTVHSGDTRAAANAPTSVLEYVRRLGEEADVPVRTVHLVGAAAPSILAEARSAAADLIVVGRSGRSGLGQPYIGSQTREVLEFAEVPVIVVPPAAG